jgi:hypothetical protein
MVTRKRVFISMLCSFLFVYIISNCNLSIYDEIRTGIRQYVDKANIYDIYPEDLISECIREGIVL